MSVMVSLEMPIQPDKFDDAVAFLRSILPDTRGFEGCEHVDTYLDREGSRALLIEIWTAPENQQAYLGWRVENGFLDQWGAFASGEANIVTWEIAADV